MGGRLSTARGILLAMEEEDRAGPPSAAFLSAQANRCVLCGMCSRVCPSYALKREEGESPRGRIVLMQAWLRGELAAAGEWRTHLDGCLGCRACEAVCPSGVPYGALLDGVRARLGEVRHTRLLRFADGIARWRRWGGVLRRLQRWYRLPGVDGMAAPPLPPQGRWRAYYPPLGPARGEEVGLFLGCVASLWDRDTLEATLWLLRLAGFGVRVPRRQGCCGALAWHEGDRARGRAQAEALVASFPGEAPVVTAATGCSVHLLDYETVLGAPGAAFARRVREAGALLAPAALPVRWRTTPVRVALHVPCTQAHGLRQPALYETLLRALPGVEVVPLTAPWGCCGAGGTHLLRRPREAAALRAPFLEAARAAGATCLLTANVGCRLHLAVGAVDMPVRHPLAFVADRIEEVER